MLLTVDRSPERIRGTHWRPVQHSMRQHDVVTEVRREALREGEKDHTITRRISTELKEIDLLLAGAGHKYAQARVESPYHRGEYTEGFVYVRSLAAFVHEDMVEAAEAAGQSRIGPGAVIHKAVKLEETASVGAYTELESRVKLLGGATVGDRAVIRKGSVIGEDGRVGSHAYVGQFSRIGKKAVLGSYTVLERGVGVGRNSSIGTQGSVGLATYVGHEVQIDDSVTIGRLGFIGNHATIGEMTTAGDHFHMGERSILGAESHLGRFVRIARGVILASPTEAPDGASLMHSNIFMGTELGRLNGSEE